jgi:hypothetical protein
MAEGLLGQQSGGYRETAYKLREAAAMARFANYRTDLLTVADSFDRLALRDDSSPHRLTRADQGEWRKSPKTSAP